MGVGRRSGRGLKCSNVWKNRPVKQKLLLNTLNGLVCAEVTLKTLYTPYYHSSIGDYG